MSDLDVTSFSNVCSVYKGNSDNWLVIKANKTRLGLPQQGIQQLSTCAFNRKCLSSLIFSFWRLPVTDLNVNLNANHVIIYSALAYKVELQKMHPSSLLFKVRFTKYSYWCWYYLFFPDDPALNYYLFLTSDVLTDTNIQSQETCLILLWSGERQAATEMKWSSPVAPRQLRSTIGAQTVSYAA